MVVTGWFISWIFFHFWITEATLIIGGKNDSVATAVTVSVSAYEGGTSCGSVISSVWRDPSSSPWLLLLFIF